MVPKENENDAYAKFGGTNKEYYGIFRGGLWAIDVIVCSKGDYIITQSYAEFYSDRLNKLFMPIFYVHNRLRV